MEQSGQNQPELLEHGLRRLIAPNPSPMTERGTNTYLVGERGIAVIDPGPLSALHLSAIVAAVPFGGRISHILVTHSHLDHSPLARPLSDLTGAPVLAFGNAIAGRTAAMQALADQGAVGGGEGVDRAFTPDRELRDGESIFGEGWMLDAIWTPGHIGNHLSFAWGDRVFTGDHVMGWASTLISPPDGDLAAYRASLSRLEGRSDRIYYPGHGAPVTDPRTRLHWLRSHRQTREDAILAAFGSEEMTVQNLLPVIYCDVPQTMWPAAARNLFAHLIDLTDRNLISSDGPMRLEARFQRR